MDTHQTTARVAIQRHTRIRTRTTRRHFRHTTRFLHILRNTKTVGDSTLDHHQTSTLRQFLNRRLRRVRYRHTSPLHFNNVHQVIFGRVHMVLSRHTTTTNNLRSHFDTTFRIQPPHVSIITNTIRTFNLHIRIVVRHTTTANLKHHGRTSSCTIRRPHHHYINIQQRAQLRTAFRRRRPTHVPGNKTYTNR